MPYQRAEKRLTEVVTLMTWSDADFIDPHLRRFVRVNVVHARGKSYDLATINCDRQMVPRIRDELRHEYGIAPVVEYAWRDIVEDRVIPESQHSDLDGHS